MEAYEIGWLRLVAGLRQKCRDLSAMVAAVIHHVLHHDAAGA
jgi:hypothetical protein